MVVRTQSNGREVSGVLIESADAHRYFSEQSGIIELQLGELRIHCELPSGFWNGRAEIRDRRLCEWLEFKVFHGRPCRTPVALELTPTGKNAFRLQAVTDCNAALCAWPEAPFAGCEALSKANGAAFRPSEPEEVPASVPAKPSVS